MQAVSWIALSLAIITSFGLLLSRDWRWRLGFLAVQYLSVFWMVQTHLPVSMAAAKLVTGWMACAVLGIAQRNVPTAVETQSALPQGRLFQFFLAGMILAVTFAGAEQATTWLGIDITVAWCSLLLIGLGLLHLGITSDAFRGHRQSLVGPGGLRDPLRGGGNIHPGDGITGSGEPGPGSCRSVFRDNGAGGRSMNAPVLWIILPLIMAGLMILITNQKAVTLIGSLFVLFLTAAAWFIPIESSLTIGSFSFNLGSSLQILGRRLSLTSADRSFLALIYGSAFFWFLPAALVRVARRLVPLGLAIIALLVAALAVEPQLYAALLIETAVLLSIPLLSTDQQKKGKGLLRFLIFQTLAVPFILFSGWILAGIEANPGNIALARQAAIFLGLGFAFLLAIFPFYTWIPLLSEEVHPFILGFILWALPTVIMFFGLGFLEHYAWLRESPATGTILSTAGVLMVVSGGLLSAFQRHLGRIMGYAVIFETGYSLLALSLIDRLGINVFLLLLVPRTLCLGIWTLSLSILKDHTPALQLSDIKGFARLWPFASAGLVLSNLTLAGVPLLAGFPVHLAIWEELARSSIGMTVWVFIGSLGLCASAIRVLSSLVSAPEGTTWGTREKGLERILLGVGWLALFLLGLFPQWVLPLWSKLPPLFEHLGQ